MPWKFDKAFLARKLALAGLAFIVPALGAIALGADTAVPKHLAIPRSSW